MKRIFILYISICLYHITMFGQKKYEMVIEKTDGTEVVIKTDEIIRTYFRELTSGNDNLENGITTPWGGVITAPIEGVWILKFAQWMWYIKGGEIYRKDTDDKEPTNYENRSYRDVIIITKSEDKYSILRVEISKFGYETGREVYQQIGNYEFQTNDRDGQRLVIISANETTLTAGFYEDYRRTAEGESQEYGILTFMREQ